MVLGISKYHRQSTTWGNLAIQTPPQGQYHLIFGHGLKYIFDQFWHLYHCTNLKRALVWLRGSELTVFPAKLHFTFASPILSFDKPSALEVAYRPPTYFKRLLKCTDIK